MEFEVYLVRHEGRVKPRHAFWINMVRGELHVREKLDSGLNRTIRLATLEASGGGAPTLLLPELFDAMLISAKPDLWVLTGWERTPESVSDSTRDCAQTWYMIPADSADLEREEMAAKRAAHDAVYPPGTDMPTTGKRKRRWG